MAIQEITKEFKSNDDKRTFVNGVFSKVAGHYDLMNTLLSFHMDSYWRHYAIKMLHLQPGEKVLDVACGTCMMTMEALDHHPEIKIEGLDYNKKMLLWGKDNLKRKGLDKSVTLTQGDAMALPYADNSFDAIMSAFAMRNVPDVGQMLKEMKRVVKPGGRVVTLELAKPSLIGFKQLYYLYFDKILPVLGKFSSKDSAYMWLPESLKRYPHQQEILKLYQKIGYVNAECIELTGGIVAVHYAEKI